MKAIKCEPGKQAEVVEIPNTLEALQEAVGGLIEVFYPFKEDVAIICNDEGKINGMEPNRAVWNEDGYIADIICGPFLIVGLTPDNFCSIPDDLGEMLFEMFKDPEDLDSLTHADRYLVPRIGFIPY